jgi:hypothetical protein
MVAFNDRRPWGYTTPGDDDFNTPLDKQAKKAANARLRNEDLSDHFEVGFSLTDKAISKANRQARRTGAAPTNVGEYISAVQEHLPTLVQKHAYKGQIG